ncbi:unnamed protein product [Calypogeia fissa]
MNSVQGFFWRTFVFVAREFLNQIADTDPKGYCRQLNIVHLIEELYKYHCLPAEITTSYMWVTDQGRHAPYFLDKKGNLMPIEEVLSKLPQYVFNLPGAGLLSRFVIHEVVARGMDHGQTIEKEKANRAATGMGMAPSTSKPKPLPKALQSKDTPRTPSPPRHTKDEVMATPPEQPKGTCELVDEPMGQGEDGPAISGHSDVSIPPEGTIDRFMDTVRILSEMIQQDRWQNSSR